ncbi:hypothetical protein VU08_00660 [Desulfobulbus sp. F5]|nr:hypothetical protein [Desulfobulbus sp. F5]
MRTLDVVKSLDYVITIRKNVSKGINLGTLNGNVPGLEIIFVKRKHVRRKLTVPEYAAALLLWTAKGNVMVMPWLTVPVSAEGML